MQAKFPHRTLAIRVDDSDQLGERSDHVVRLGVEALVVEVTHAAFLGDQDRGDAEVAGALDVVVEGAADEEGVARMVTGA